MLMHEIPPRGYGKVAERWAVRPPKAARAQYLSADVVSEHEDGTITVSGKISVGEPGTIFHWEGFLIHGEWHEAA